MYRKMIMTCLLAIACLCIPTAGYADEDLPGSTGMTRSCVS